MSKLSFQKGKCCAKLVISGHGDFENLHSEKLGIYEKTTVPSIGDVFKLSGKEYYLHRNPSFNWMVKLA